MLKSKQGNHWSRGMSKRTSDERWSPRMLGDNVAALLQLLYLENSLFTCCSLCFINSGMGFESFSTICLLNSGLCICHLKYMRPDSSALQDTCTHTMACCTELVPLISHPETPFLLREWLQLKLVRSDCLSPKEYTNGI